MTILKLILILSFIMVIANAEEPTLKLTLDESISIALKGGTSVLKAQQDKDLSGTQVLQSYLQFLPNLKAEGDYNKSKGKSYLTSAKPTLVNGSSYGPSYTISTTLNIFNGFSDLASWNASQERRNAAQKTLHRAKQQISLDIAQSYLQVMLDRKIVEIAEKNLLASRDRQALLEGQTQVGIRNKSDLFRQQAQTSTDESFLITVQNKRQSDMINLLNKLRLNLDAKYELAESSLEDQVNLINEKMSVQDEQKSIQQALENRQDYSVSILNAKAAQHDTTAARAAFLPKLDFSANYFSSARIFDYIYVNGANETPASHPSIGNQLRNQGSYVYGIVLTWNIFDRWSNSYNVEKNKVSVFKAQLDSEDYRNQVIGEVKQALNDLKAAVLQLSTSQKGLSAAQKAYEVSTGLYEVGSLSYVDLATAQTVLVQAQAARAQALIGYELQKKTVDFVLGITAVNIP